MVIIDNGAGPEPTDQLLWSIKTVIVKTGLSRASIYRYIKRERFPPRRRVGPNRVAWVPAEVIAWTEARPKLGQGRGTAKNRPVTNLTVRDRLQRPHCQPTPSLSRPGTMEHLMLVHRYWLQQLITQHSDRGLIARIRFQTREKSFGPDRR